MKFFVQYDELGNIGSTVYGDIAAPICDRQIEFEEIIDIKGKRVNLDTLTLEDAPPEESLD